MRSLNKTNLAFFSLLRAGLWEQSVRLLPYEPLDFDALYRLAEEQSVVGLVAAGLEHVEDWKVSKQEALPFMKNVFSTESRNASMNRFIGELITRMREAGIYALLVKGQGVAQCYTRPQWRSSGDIDFIFDDENYAIAKEFMIPLAISLDAENGQHISMTVDSWVVELHGNMNCGLSVRMDSVIQDVQDAIFRCGNVRVWKDGETDVFLPDPDNDVIFIFTHFLKHFYKGGIGLRQICDWCRLLWTYSESIDRELLENRLCSMGLMSEWRAFAVFAVECLGMPEESMPLYIPSYKWKRKALRIKSFIMKVGNFGHNRDMSYYKKYPYLVRKTISLGRRFGDLCRHALIFPLDSLRFFPTILKNGVRSALKGV